MTNYARGVVTCQICGLMYDVGLDKREHSSRHKIFLAVSAKYAEPAFGEFLWGYERREKAKRERQEGNYVAFLGHIYAWYCRCIIADPKHPNLKQPTFTQYCAMMIPTVENIFSEREPKCVEAFRAQYYDPFVKTLKAGFTDWKSMSCEVFDEDVVAT